jgi:Ca2+-binding RTX toxin-like protein
MPTAAIIPSGNPQRLISGGDTNDTLSGTGSIKTTYYGNGGDDQMTAPSSVYATDIVHGGEGIDTIRGKQGSDTYYIDPGEADSVQLKRAA